MEKGKVIQVTDSKGQEVGRCNDYETVETKTVFLEKDATGKGNWGKNRLRGGGKAIISESQACNKASTKCSASCPGTC